MYRKLKRLSLIVRYIHNWPYILSTYIYFRIVKPPKCELHIKWRFSNCPTLLESCYIHHLSKLLELVEALNAKYDPCTDTLEYTYNNILFKWPQILSSAHKITGNYDSFIDTIKHTFVDNEWGFLDVEGATVLDIGGYIGDTALYFIGRGAKKVVVYEANPLLCSYLEQVIAENSLDNIVDIRCKAIAPPTENTPNKFMLCIPAYRGTLMAASARLVSSEKECQSRQMVYDAKIVEVDIEPANILPRTDIAKIDCEGCEYHIVSVMEEPIYSEMGLEFHGDPKPLVDKLKNLGYNVRVLSTKSDPMYGSIGFIHAILKH